MVLEPLASPSLQISLHDESGQKEDIITYIKSVVGSDKTMQQLGEKHQSRVIDVLSQKVDGV
jgi:tRNA A37 threonylcarbamoyladenosine synthetase subunit TsaC/SUA5/YrdC